MHLSAKIKEVLETGCNYNFHLDTTTKKSSVNPGVLRPPHRRPAEIQFTWESQTQFETDFKVSCLADQIRWRLKKKSQETP